MAPLNGLVENRESTRAATRQTHQTDQTRLMILDLHLHNCAPRPPPRSCTALLPSTTFLFLATYRPRCLLVRLDPLQQSILVANRPRQRIRAHPQNRRAGFQTAGSSEEGRWGHPILQLQDAAAAIANRCGRSPKHAPRFARTLHETSEQSHRTVASRWYQYSIWRRVPRHVHLVRRHHNRHETQRA